MMGPNPNNTSLMPARVAAAFTFLGYCESVTHQCDPATVKYELSATEALVKQAALEVLRLYLVGEMDFGDAPASARDPRDEGDHGAAPLVPA